MTIREERAVLRDIGDDVVDGGGGIGQSLRGCYSLRGRGKGRIGKGPDEGAVLQPGGKSWNTRCSAENWSRERCDKGGTDGLHFENLSIENEPSQQRD